MCEICSKLTIKTPGVLIVNFEQVNADWVHYGKNQLANNWDRFLHCKLYVMF